MKLRISTRTVRKLVSAGLTVVLMLVFSLTADAFWDWRNMGNLFHDAAFLGLIALGLSFVMIGGGIDLSVGGIVCVAAILASRFSFMADSSVPGVLVALFAVLCGAVCGLVNGLLVTRARLTEFVATLATGILFSGLGLLFAYRDNGRISGVIVPKGIMNDGFLSLGEKVGGSGIFLVTYIWIILSVAMYFVLRRTNFGLHTYAIGSHNKSAEMSGVNAKRVKAAGFVISGSFAGLASALLTANMTAASASLGSNGYEFQAIAACVVGGIALGGGKGDTVNAVIGAIFLHTILNGLYKFQIQAYWSYVIQGMIIIAATAFDALFTRVSRALRERRAQLRADVGKEVAGA
ncbi:MAG: ABC transporter permease [Oscillospiraceae bacterium]|jgi:ribose transport system permease protein|nr:ABC transporter permease [Oscillospiraceae bacterium]